MPLQERNLVNPQRCEGFKGIPINRGRNPTIENAEERINNIAQAAFFEYNLLSV